VEKIWETLDNEQRFAIIQEKGVEKEVLKMFRLTIQSGVFSVDNYISRSKIKQALKSLSLTSTASPASTNWRQVWGSIHEMTEKIGLFYTHFDKHMWSAEGQVTRLAIEDFAKSIIQPNNGIASALNNLNRLIVPKPPSYQTRGNNTGNPEASGNAAALHKLYAVLNEKEGINLCNLGQSPHQVIYNLYNIIALTEIKGYAMIQFSYMMLRLYGRGNFTLESDMAKRSFESQATEKLLAVKSILPHMDKMLWSCDPNIQNEHLTYEKLTLLQGHIENEVDMNDISTCRHSCSTYDAAEPKGCFKNLLCAKQQRCTGRLFDCQFYHADAWVCMSQDPTRRYDWIEYEDGRILGKKDQCANKIKVDSWWRWIFYHCSYCLCKCDAPGPESDRFWSLKEATSNIKKGFVVTGVRIRKIGRVLHPEVEQARALPEGSVDESSKVWLEAREVRVSDDTAINRTATNYMTMSYEQRSVDLDRLSAPPGHVVTGIKFRNLGGHLNLEIRVTPIKFREGKLIPSQSVWISNDNTPASLAEPRTQIRALDPDISTRFRGHSVIDSGKNQYIQFDTTAAKKDVQQTTVPFIDVQKVSPSTGTWLSGVGVYHKGALGYGGYIALSLDTFDFSRHLLPDDTSAEQQEDQEGRMARLRHNSNLSHEALKYDFNQID